MIFLGAFVFMVLRMVVMICGTVMVRFLRTFRRSRMIEKMIMGFLCVYGSTASCMSLDRGVVRRMDVMRVAALFTSLSPVSWNLIGFMDDIMYGIGDGNDYHHNLADTQFLAWMRLVYVSPKISPERKGHMTSVRRTRSHAHHHDRVGSVQIMSSMITLVMSNQGEC